MATPLFRRTLLAGLALPALARAQPFVGRTVRLLFGFGPGTPPDMIGRLLAPRLADKLGGTFVVEARPGAGERVAVQAVLDAPADGNTLMLVTGSQTVIQATDPALRYDLRRDLRFITMLVRYPFLLVVRGDSPYRTLKQLLDASRAAPGKIAYASAGVGTTTHLGMELLLRQAGVSMLHVPYVGGSRTAAELQAGTVQTWYATFSGVMGQLRGGSVHALAVTSPERDPLGPEVPTVAETVPGHEVVTWVAAMARAGTPEALVRQLNQALREAMAEPEIGERMAGLGYHVNTTTPEEITARVAADIAKWQPLADLVKQGG